MDLLRQKVESDFQSLRKTLDTLNDSMSNLSVGLQEHKEQTTAELAHLQTSLNSTQSSLDNQTGQLNKLDGLSTELCSKLDTLNSTQSSNAMQLNNKLDGLSTELCSKLDTLNSTQSSNAMHLNNKLDDMSSKKNAHHSIITEHQQQTTVKLAHLQTSLNSTKSSLDNQTGQLNKLDGLSTDLCSKLDKLNSTQSSNAMQLNNKLDDMSSKANAHHSIITEHQQQTTAELAHLQTSLNSTQSSNAMQLINKLDDMSSKTNAHHSIVTEHQQQTTAELAHLQTSLNSTQSSLDNQTGQLNKLDGLSTELCSKLDTLNSTQSSNAMELNNKLDDLSSKTNARHSIITEHQQQTTAKLAHLQTSLNSKLDSLTTTAAQLSSDHQEIQTNISDVQCMDTQPSLQLHQNLHNNLTHQLKKIQNDVIFIREQHSCGGTEGWRRVVYLNMADPHTTCPPGWNITGYSKRTCGRNSTGFYTCSSATFPVSGGEYDSVCGRIKAYQWGNAVAFENYHLRGSTTIDNDYACGVSVTHGTPRNHIWTFVTGKSEGNPTWKSVCPCDATSTIPIPPFVGNDYFCESGVNEQWTGSSNHFTFHPNDPLWDGEDCLPSSTCCSLHNPPYFVKQLPTPTTDVIEARICLFYPFWYSNVAVELVELYVQ